jgi:3D (Asp-Asp-Asp) domain-containing protein
MAALSPPTAPRRLRARRSRLLLAAIAGPAALLGLIVGLVLLLAGIAAQQRTCAPGGLPGSFDGPGSLGGVAGTGLNEAQIQTVRSASPYRGTRISPGRYLSTAYGPPWGGIQGAGAFTSGGIALAGGAPLMYMIAVDPLVISHGTLVYAWPNPFRWPGPFLAADTGAAIKGRHIDFYDWRGRRTQLRWRQPDTTISSRPIKPGGPDVSTIKPPGSCTPTAALTGPVGRRIATLANQHLGAGPRIRGFQPPATALPWCEWFASNIYRQAGVPGWSGTDLYSGTPYAWAQTRGQLFKTVGQPPAGPTPPLGAAVMYGSGPHASEHVNLVTRIYPDGAFELVGGNQTCPGGPNCVSRRGPCRLTRTVHARLTGPACGESREVYGIASPTRGPR